MFFTSCRPSVGFETCIMNRTRLMSLVGQSISLTVPVIPPTCRSREVFPPYGREDGVDEVEEHGHEGEHLRRRAKIHICVSLWSSVFVFDTLLILVWENLLLPGLISLQIIVPPWEYSRITVYSLYVSIGVNESINYYKCMSALWYAQDHHWLVWSLGTISTYFGPFNISSLI